MINERKVCEKKVGQYPASPTISWVPVENWQGPKCKEVFCDLYCDYADGCPFIPKKVIVNGHSSD